MIKLKNIIKEIMDAPPLHPPAITQQYQAPRQATNVVNQQMLEDGRLIAATLWGEARGEGEKGMQSVLNVIMNRAGGDIKKAAGVCLSPKQFSFWNKIPDPREYATTLSTQRQNDVSYKKAVGLVDKAIQNQLKDITGGAKFYFNPKLANPSWAKKMTKTAVVGNHDFYKLNPKKKK